MNLGFDYGSTYSTVAKYDKNKGVAEPLSECEGVPASIPSVVSLSRNGQFNCGSAAKNLVGKRSVRIFEAFKMLLNESNQELLRSRGYDSEHTPQMITKKFIGSVLQGVMEREGCEKLDRVVICAPEIWWSKATTLDGRAILRTIIKEELGIPVKEVQVVTEPEAASAFIAYNYEQETKKGFNGHLLLIDYGGGTLDLTLTQVVSDGRGGMEITYRESGGAGENHPDQKGSCTIGKAGIAYMQNVVERALRDAGVIGPEEPVDYTSPYFVEAVKDLESQLKAPERCRDIVDVFGGYGQYSEFKKILKAKPIEFTFLEYDEDEVSVTYQHLFLSYREVIEQVLEQELCKIAELAIPHLGFDPRSEEASVRDDFKIAMVGGFCNYYLVRQQIAQIYNLDPNNAIDQRVKNVSAGKQEQAIALGAALLAEKKVELIKTARFSIGIYSSGYNGTKKLSYGIKYHQIVEPGVPYFLCHSEEMDDVPQNRIVYGSIQNNIDSFAIEYSHDRNRGGLLVLKEEMRRKLSCVPECFCNVGFSMDENDVISFHVVPTRFGADSEIVTPEPIALGRFSNLFELTHIEEVVV